MRITSVESFCLKIKAHEAYLGRLADGSLAPAGYHVRKPWRSLYSPRFETVIVKVTAEDGTAGWGESLAPVAPEVPAAIIDLLLAPVLVGASATAPRPNWTMLSELMRERGHLAGHQADALAAVDVALWDLAGKLWGQPVASLLGGAFREFIPAYVSGLPRATDEERSELASEWEQKGATAVKLHLGHGIENDLATVDAVTGAAPRLKVAVDAHWAYSQSEALRLANGLADRGAWFLEAPLAPEDEEGHAELRARSRIPIAVGETLRNRYEFSRWHRARSLDISQPDIGRTGITEGMVIGELAAANHVPVAPHHSVGMGIVLAAGLHVSAATQNLMVFEYQPTSTQVGQIVLKTPIEPLPNGFNLPAGPGLGIDVDEQQIRNLAKESQH